MDSTNFPNIVIKETEKNGIKIVKDKNHWKLIGDVQFMQLHTKSNVEIKQQYSSYDLAYGDVLVTGFGFGHLSIWLSKKPEVKSITVIEYYQEVIDLFLENNTLPDNVKIIIADAYTYKTDKHYNCLLLDHYKDQGKENKIKFDELYKIANNIPHDVFWVWSLEQYFALNFCSIDLADLYVLPQAFPDLSYVDEWKQLLNCLDIPTIPDLDKSTILKYMNYYFNRV